MLLLRPGDAEALLDLHGMGEVEAHPGESGGATPNSTDPDEVPTCHLHDHSSVVSPGSTWLCEEGRGSRPPAVRISRPWPAFELRVTTSEPLSIIVTARCGEHWRRR